MLQSELPTARSDKMDSYRASRMIATGLALLVLLGGALPVLRAHAGGDKEPGTSVIRVAPPAPVIEEKARLAELADRRARVAQSIGPKGILILFSTEPRVYTNDVDYQYRQENNL